MNKQQAINLLKNLEQSLDDYCELNDEGKTAFCMAIEALNRSEFPNNSDTISRQAAIDAVKSISDSICEQQAIDALCELPSIDAVPVIRCKDCVCWDTSWKPTRAIEGAYWCSNNDIYMESDDYCSLAERKES